MKRPFKCPVCNGSTIVPGGFYSGNTSGTCSFTEKCQTCDNGIVWGDDGESGAPVARETEPTQPPVSTWVQPPYVTTSGTHTPPDLQVTAWYAPNAAPINDYNAWWDRTVQRARGD